MISEKIELLGKGLYSDIPDVLTLKSIPTASELEYVGGEDFDKIMLDRILPSAVEEKIDFRKLLEIDYYWLCRALRILNYGPYYTTTTIYCSDCNNISHGEYRVNLYSVETKPLPQGFKNSITIARDEFIEFGKEVKIQLLTIQEVLDAYKDKAFTNPQGKTHRDFARMCYMIKAIGTNNAVNPIEVNNIIRHEMSPADYRILKDTVANLTDYGLRAGGLAQCPRCHSKEARFVAFVDDKFFRPTLGDLKQWRADRSKGGAENPAGDKTKTV